MDRALPCNLGHLFFHALRPLPKPKLDSFRVPAVTPGLFDNRQGVDMIAGTLRNSKERRNLRDLFKPRPIGPGLPR